MKHSGAATSDGQTTMTPNGLLRSLAGLTHDARMRRMVEVGRLAAVDGSVAATLAALEQQGFYERSLALQSCYGSRDGAHVVRAMSDPSSSIRALASQLLPMACDDTQVEEALEVVPDLEQALDRGLALAGAGGELVVLPTYTAMLALRRIVARRGHVRQYWERAA